MKQTVSDILYRDLNYMYCDNCRFDSEEDGSDACEDCHRKYNGWALSRSEADRLSDRIVELAESRLARLETNLYDKEEIFHNCTVQVLTNTVTGKTSIGWWPSDTPPDGLAGEP